MPTVSQMVITSLISLGDKQIGDTLSAAEQTHYLSKMNSMLDSWSVERLFVYQQLQESLALTTNVGSYTIGVGGAFNTTRPTKITYAFIRDTSLLDTELTNLNSQENYDRIVLKTTGITYPQYFWYDTAWVAGLGKIFLYPLPKASLTLFIESWKQLQQFTAINDALSLPPGYQRAIESNFAIEVAPGFTAPDPSLIQIAKESKAAIKSLNLPAPTLRLDPAIVGGLRRGASILTGP